MLRGRLLRAHYLCQLQVLIASPVITSASTYNGQTKFIICHSYLCDRWRSVCRSSSTRDARCPPVVQRLHTHFHILRSSYLSHFYSTDSKASSISTENASAPLDMPCTLQYYQAFTNKHFSFIDIPSLELSHITAFLHTQACDCLSIKYITFLYTAMSVIEDRQQSCSSSSTCAISHKRTKSCCLSVKYYRQQHQQLQPRSHQGQQQSIYSAAAALLQAVVANAATTLKEVAHMHTIRRLSSL